MHSLFMLLLCGGLAFGWAGDAYAQEGVYIGKEQLLRGGTEGGSQGTDADASQWDEPTERYHSTYETDSPSPHQDTPSIKAAKISQRENTEKKEAPTDSAKKEAESMLSFNVIYYIIQKLKFPNRFE